jgi:phage shock protein PspC (stress-responsive transcriptional regulator)
MIDAIRHFFERNGFGVFSRLADRLGIRALNVRLFFIYVTMAFVLKLKDMIYTKRSSVFDL